MSPLPRPWAGLRPCCGGRPAACARRTRAPMSSCTDPGCTWRSRVSPVSGPRVGDVEAVDGHRGRAPGSARQAVIPRSGGQSAETPWSVSHLI